MDDGAVRETATRRWLHAALGAFSARRRAMTDLEWTQQSEVRRLRALLEERDARIRDLRAELEDKNASIQIRNNQIAQLADVIARDRARVQAETAAYARQIAGADPG